MTIEPRDLIGSMPVEQLDEALKQVSPEDWGRFVIEMKKTVVAELAEQGLIDPTNPNDVLALHSAVDEMMVTPVDGLWNMLEKPVPPPKSHPSQQVRPVPPTNVRQPGFQPGALPGRSPLPPRPGSLQRPANGPPRPGTLQRPPGQPAPIPPRAGTGQLNRVDADGQAPGKPQ